MSKAGKSGWVVFWKGYPPNLPKPELICILPWRLSEDEVALILETIYKIHFSTIREQLRYSAKGKRHSKFSKEISHRRVILFNTPAIVAYYANDIIIEAENRRAGSGDIVSFTTPNSYKFDRTRLKMNLVHKGQKITYRIPKLFN